MKFYGFFTLLLSAIKKSDKNFIKKNIITKKLLKNGFCDEVSHNGLFFKKFFRNSKLDIYKCPQKCPIFKTLFTFWKKFVVDDPYHKKLKYCYNFLPYMVSIKNI
jgi:hypothetical protein